jgi:voltage-gated potassium channel
MNIEEKTDSSLKQHLRSVIFGTETLAGKRFDIALMVCIVLSVVLIFIDTIEQVNSQYGDYIQIAEWTFTVIFTVEYILRLYCSLNRLHYVRSFFGVVDLVSILPSYLDLIFPGANVALALRVLRLFRVFRVLKLLRYLRDGHILLKAMMQSSRKVFMFFFAVSLIIMVLSVIMYVVEGPNNGFTSIPQSLYWTVVSEPVIYVNAVIVARKATITMLNIVIIVVANWKNSRVTYLEPNLGLLINIDTQGY